MATQSELRAISDPDRPDSDDGDEPTPGEQPAVEESPALDDAPVPPLTAPSDTDGG